MKFKREVFFDGIERARSYWCHIILGDGAGVCKSCRLRSDNNGEGITCTEFCESHPKEAAEIMGFDIDECESDEQTKISY